MTISGDDLLQRLDPGQRDLLRACGRMAAARDAAAYLVGGSVRDLVLERAHDDLDVVVEGDGMAVAQDLAREVGGELTRHHAFQTATVTTPEGLRVDVATARSEVYPRPGQLPQVVPGTLEEDLMRRDFTINTMAIALDEEGWGRMIDPLGGGDDLAAGRIRVMHVRSFADDPTRILRALRFSVRFGYRLDDGTHARLRDAVEGGYLQDVSGDRVRKELRLTLGEAPVEGPLRLQEEGVLAGLQAGLHAEERPLERLRELIDWFAALPADAGVPPSSDAWTLTLACCAEPLPQQARWDLARRLGLSRGDRVPLLDSGTPARRALEQLAAAEAPAASEVERLLRPVPAAALLVRAATSPPPLTAIVRRYLAELRAVEARLSGDELQELGVPEGPRIGEILDRLRAARLDGAAPTAADERRLVQAWMAEEPL